jgi:hypothetical protein
MSEPKSTGPLILPASKVTQGAFPVLAECPMYDTSKKKENFSFGGSSHQTGAAFTPATPHDLQHLIANTDSQNPHITLQTRAK